MKRRLSEARMKDLAHDLANMRDQDFVRKYKMSKTDAKSKFELKDAKKKVVAEGEVVQGPWGARPPANEPAKFIGAGQLKLPDRSVIYLTSREEQLIRALLDGPKSATQLTRIMYPVDPPESKIIQVFVAKINRKAMIQGGLIQGRFWSAFQLAPGLFEQDLDEEPDDGIIDKPNGPIQIAGQLVHLTGKEREIIQHLRKAARGLTAEALLDRLYGNNDQPEIRIIDVFVTKLNKKVQQVTDVRQLVSRGRNGEYILNAPKQTGVREAAEGLSGESLVRHLTSICMQAWYALDSKFKAKPDQYDIHGDAPDGNGKFNVIKMTPGNDVTEDVFGTVINATNALTKSLNGAFGKTVFEPRIQRSEGNLETLVGFMGSKGGVLQCRATNQGGDSEIYLTMPVEAELKRAFSAMTDQPVPQDDGAAELDDPDFAPVASADAVPDMEPTDDFDMPPETPGFDEVPMDDDPVGRRFEGLNITRRQTMLRECTQKLARAKTAYEMRALKLEQKKLSESITAEKKRAQALTERVGSEMKQFSDYATPRLRKIHENCIRDYRRLRKENRTLEAKVISLRALAVEHALAKRGLLEADKMFKVAVADPNGDEETTTEVQANNPRDAQSKVKRKVRGKVTSVEEPIEESMKSCERKAKRRRKSALGEQLRSWQIAAEEVAANSVAADGVDMAPDAKGSKKLTRRQKLPEFVTLRPKGFSSGPFG